MTEPLKHMYNATFVADLSAAVVGVQPTFPAAAFQADVFDQEWETRELKARSRYISLMLARHLPPSYAAALAILRQAAQSPRLTTYRYEPIVFAEFVEVFGLADWALSMAAMEQFTAQPSAEFAVRPFILQDSPRMMAQMLAWASSPNMHLRRLASEGCRPRLPWAVSLPDFKRDPSPILPILHTLRNDASDYVRRSVANNLNDIGKDHPEVVLTTLQDWNRQPTDDIRWISKHALRSLVKQGHPEALALLGFQGQAVRVEGLQITPTVLGIGEVLHIGFRLHSDSEQLQTLVVDYVVHFARANGKMGNKVFKLANVSLAPNAVLSFEKRHSFKPISTRRYYQGEHIIQIQVNGQVLAEQRFQLLLD